MRPAWTPLRLPSRGWLIAGAAAVALLGGIGAAGTAGGGTHYALDPLRDCLALRGGLVTFVAGGTGSEGTARLEVKGDSAMLAFAHDGAEAGSIESAVAGGTRHGNLVVYAAVAGAGARAGSQSAATIERCLSDGHGHPKLAPTGYAYPSAALAAFQAACSRAKASAAQCNCVLTGAEARLPLADFQRIAEATVVDEEAQMTAILDGCRLVG